MIEKLKKLHLDKNKIKKGKEEILKQIKNQEDKGKKDWTFEDISELFQKHMNVPLEEINPIICFSLNEKNYDKKRKGVKKKVKDGI